MHWSMRQNGSLAVALTAVLFVALASAGPARAQNSGGPNGAMRPGMGPGMDGGMVMGRIFRQLNLTPAQQQEVKGVLQNHEQELKKLSDEAFSARQGLHKAVVADNDAEIAKANSELSAAQLNMEKLHAAIRAQIFDSVLTPEQRTKANSAEARFEQRMAGRHQKQQQQFSQWLAGAQASGSRGE
jgi:Spy/CpxP family protein refolding chaperone